jgi:hypothetical protein
MGTYTGTATGCTISIGICIAIGSCCVPESVPPEYMAICDTGDGEDTRATRKFSDVRDAP